MFQSGILTASHRSTFKLISAEKECIKKILVTQKNHRRPGKSDSETVEDDA